MKRWGLFLVFLLLLVAFLPALSLYVRPIRVEADEFYFGVSFDGDSAEEAFPLIDKIKGYANLFIINSWGIATNQTALNMLCDYAADSGLHFIVFFAFISRTMYPWHQQWLDEAHQRWGDKFLGLYLNDEYGGKQIEGNELFTTAANYADAADRFVNGVKFGPSGEATSMLDANAKGIRLFTADFLLYWWDYLAGYDVVFAELGWNITSNRQIALCRGAATAQGKDWGTIITYETDTPPYLGSAEKIYRDMIDSYRAGAKYVAIFNYPTYPENNPYGILSEDHFEVMHKFWQYTKSYPRSFYGVAKADTVLVLPSNYGWGMRRSPYITDDFIWGIWPEDDKAPQILNNVQWLETRHNLQFDIIYENSQFNYSNIYPKIIHWNTTIP
ncbi:MAG: hypothetical protein LBC12_07970 [Nitrososphaerota archaeon]|nr:hypothetical protein [Nitrososphaerota archaeon]